MKQVPLTYRSCFQFVPWNYNKREEKVHFNINEDLRSVDPTFFFLHFVVFLVQFHEIYPLIGYF